MSMVLGMSTIWGLLKLGNILSNFANFIFNTFFFVVTDDFI